MSEKDLKAFENLVNKQFERGPVSDLAVICTEILQIPKIFKSMLKDRIQKTHPTAITGDKL